MNNASLSAGLPKRPFGSTGLMVDPVCLGCGVLSDSPQSYGYSTPKERGLATLRAALDGPIHFLDTSNNYGQGRSEECIGLVLRERGGLPEGFMLSTKADRDMQTGEFSGDRMRKSVEESQKRLGMDHLPILFLHDPEYVTFEEITKPGGAMDALVKLRDEGVIGHLGVAGGPIDLMTRYVQTGVFEAVISHNRYNLLNQDADPLYQLAAEKGMAIMNAAPYGSGILAKGPNIHPRYMYRPAPPEMLERAKQLETVCARFGVPLAAAALQFSLRDPRITSTIVGMSHPIRLAQTLALATYPIPEELWPELEKVGKVQ